MVRLFRRRRGGENDAGGEDAHAGRASLGGASRFGQQRHDGTLREKGKCLAVQADRKHGVVQRVVVDSQLAVHRPHRRFGRTGLQPVAERSKRIILPRAETSGAERTRQVLHCGARPAHRCRVEECSAIVRREQRGAA